MKKQTIAKYIKTSPDVIQFTKDRKYEEAWIISLSKPKPTEKQINQYLKKEKIGLIIVEYIWNSEDDDKRFVLTFFLEKCKLTDKKRFMEICLDLFYSNKNFTEIIEAMDEQIIGKNYLFKFPIEGVNIGVFNHWLSVGPVDLWNKGEKYEFNTMVKRLKSKPDVEKSRLNYQGLLFRFNVSGKYDGPYYGFKTPCCKKVGKYWLVDYKTIDFWITTLLLKENVIPLSLKNKKRYSAMDKDFKNNSQVHSVKNVSELIKQLNIE